MINILLSFIKAERTVNWTMQLQALSDMLPYFAALANCIQTLCISTCSLCQNLTAHIKVHMPFSESYVQFKNIMLYVTQRFVDIIMELYLDISIIP